MIKKMRAKLQKGTKTRTNWSLAKPGFPWRRRATQRVAIQYIQLCFDNCVPLYLWDDGGRGNMLRKWYKKWILWIWSVRSCVLNRYGDNVRIPNVNESRPHVAPVYRSVVTLNVEASFAQLLIERLKCYSQSFHCTWRHTKPCYNIINTRWRHH